MAKDNRRPKTATPRQRWRRTARKMRLSLWILLAGAVILGFILAGVGFYAQLQHAPPTGNQDIESRHDAAGNATTHESTAKPTQGESREPP